MFPVGGVGVMLVGVVLTGLFCLLVLAGLRPRLGAIGAGVLALLLWSLFVLGLITLLPAHGAPGIVSAEGRLDHCSFDVGGPAPDGFWIFGGGQRLLNTVIFLPSGALMVLAALRYPRTAVATIPVGLVLLAAYSTGIELTQLELARLDRACDVTDIIDNTTGAVLGGAAGLLLAPFLRPWRGRRLRADDPEPSP